MSYKKTKFLQPTFPAVFWDFPDKRKIEVPSAGAVTILTPELTVVCIIENYRSLQFFRRWHQTGEFELRINKHLPYANELTRGRLIMVGADQSKVGLIKHRSIALNEGGKISEEWVIRGDTLEGICKRRLTVPPDLGWDVGDAVAETVMKQYVNNNIVAPQNDLLEERKVDFISIAEDQERGRPVYWQSRYKNLAEELELLSIRSGLGWFMYPDFSTGNWEFEVESGVDRSVQQIDRSPVVFSVGFNTLRELSFMESYYGFKNVAYVAGQGEGSDREIARVTADTYEATRVEATDTEWAAGVLSNTEPEDNDLILTTDVPAGEDVTRVEQTSTHWDAGYLEDFCISDEGNLIIDSDFTAAGNQSFTATGSFSWTAPKGIIDIELLIVAAGGGSGASRFWTIGGDPYAKRGGCGGGGEVYHNQNYSINGGETYTGSVGVGGGAGVAGSITGGRGGISSFGSNQTRGGGGGGGSDDPDTGSNGQSGGSGGGGVHPSGSAYVYGTNGGGTSKLSNGFGNSGGGSTSSQSEDGYFGGGGANGSGGRNSRGAARSINDEWYSRGGGADVGSGNNYGYGADPRDPSGTSAHTRAGKTGNQGAVRLWYPAAVKEVNRRSPGLSLDGIYNSGGSSVSWSETVPTGGEVKVYACVTESSVPPDVDSVAWVEQTSGQALTVIDDNQDYNGHYLHLKQWMRQNNTEGDTPQIDSLSVEVQDESIRYYDESGTRVSPPMALEGAVKVDLSTISWTQDLPANTSLTVETAVNSDSETEPVGDYTEATNGESIPGLLVGDDLASKYLWIKQSLSTTDTTETPRLKSLSASVIGAESEDAVFPTGIDRFELFVDARDLAEAQFLPARGKNRLSEFAQLNYLQAQVLSHSIHRYMIDYNLGDQVTIRNQEWGIEFTARVTEAKEVYEPAGYQLFLIFGNSIPNLVDHVKHTIAGIENEMRR